ncbi:MAG: hypothetical protein CVU56_20545 [Deltaproteobacteria bacterium HGW-Deltaproteobacteria-14]|jgi:hypothetical protein|nr:MAG: hypothetical protein CVU56_20545 [Deltaproteobacteria bacterium HGW-Deltaproteobacteria-14]
MRIWTALAILGALAAPACDGGSELSAPMAALTDTDVTPTPQPPVPVTATAPLPPVTVEVPPAPQLPGGDTDGTAVLFEPADLEVDWLYGMGSDPDGVIGSLGGGAAGIAPVRVRVVLEDGVAAIRTLDARSGAPVAGAAGLVESYPYTTLEDGRVRVDFAAPVVAPGFAVFDTCTYELDRYTLAGAPVFADGLVTWPGDERYVRSGCPNWAPPSADGVNVHFLRHPAAAAAYTPRRADLASPFGFFLAPVAGEPDAAWLARLGGIRPGAADHTITYYLSPSFPEAYSGAARHVFDTWNDALEDATGVRPFVVARAGDDIIPWDPRFHVVLWRETGSGGAVAPFAQDPATGEIVQSFVVMWFGELDDLVARYHDFFGAHPDLADLVLDDVPPPKPQGERRGQALTATFGAPQVPARYLRRSVYTQRPLGLREVAQARATLGRDATDEEVTNAIVADFLIHEMGHNLGLRHNFVGSADWDHTTAGESSSTTMDYVIGLTHPGAYDRDAMRYGYGAGALDETFLYCTDEDLDVVPGCVQWDFGHPLRYTLEQIDRIIAGSPPETPTSEVTTKAQEQDWSSVFLRIRGLINTVWEGLDPADPADGFQELLDRVVCAGECATHEWIRTQLALQLLYTRHAVQAWWEPGAPTRWYDLPALDETEAVTLMTSLYDLVVDSAQPQTLRLGIVNKLPTANVDGATTLLDELHGYFGALGELSTNDQAVLSAIEAALGG